MALSASQIHSRKMSIFNHSANVAIFMTCLFQIGHPRLKIFASIVIGLPFEMINEKFTYPVESDGTKRDINCSFRCFANGSALST